MKHNTTESVPHDAHTRLHPAPTAPAPEPPTTGVQPHENHQELIRGIQHLGVWLNRQAASGPLAGTLEAILSKLDEILDHLRQDRTSGQLMSIKAAAQYLSLSERTIRERIALREWPAYRSGKAVRVDPEEILTRMRNRV